jgi:uncharacterized protein (TIGR02099 family)
LRWRLTIIASWLALALATAALLFAASAAAVRHLLLPKLPLLKDEIALVAGRTIGAPVSIGELEAGWRGWNPVLELRELRIGAADAGSALHFEQVRGVLSWQSVAKLWPVFESLDLGSPSLSIRRTRDGRLHLAGLVLDPRGTLGDGAGRASDWLADQKFVRIREAVIVWHDETLDEPPARLSEARLVLVNRGLHHKLRLEARAHSGAADAGRLVVIADFQHPVWSLRAGDWTRWRGSAYAEVERASLARLAAHLDLPGIAVQRGEGGLRAWADVSSRKLRRLTADVQMHDVQTRLAAGVEPLALATLHGRIVVAMNQPGDAQGVQLGTEGLHWQQQGRAPVGPLDLQWRSSRPGEPEQARGALLANTLDLGDLQTLAQHLPLPEGLRAALKRHNPRGQVQQLALQWQGPFDAPRGYQLRAQVQQLALDGVPAAAAATPSSGAQHPLHPGIPGLSGLSGSVEASERGGSAQFAVRGGSVDLPGVFEQPRVDIAQLAARAQWRRDAAGWTVELDVPELANADAAGRLRATWKQTAGGPGQLDLRAGFTRADARRTWRYLPLSVPQATRDYLRQALVEGRSNDVQVTLKGDLARFPFSDRSGEFLVVAKVEDGVLDYAPARGAQPGWPAFSRVQGQLVFEREALKFRDFSARYQNVQLSGVRGQIPDLMHTSSLTLEGSASGPLDEQLRYVQASPLATGGVKVLARARAGGNARLELKLAIPLAQAADTKVEGRVLLAGNDLALGGELPSLGRAQGQVSFSERGFAIGRGTTALLFGGEAAIDGGTRADGSVQINLAGSAQAEGLRREKAALGALAALAERMSGQTRYDAAVTVRANGLTELTVQSSLQGLALDLPAPLAKPADAALALKLGTQLGLPAPDGSVPDTLSLNLGPAIAARYERLHRPTAGGGWDTRVLRGGIGIQQPAVAPDNGVFAHVTLPRVDVDAWLALLKRLGLDSEPGSVGSDSASYAPNLLAFDAGELTIFNKQFNRAIVGASKVDGQWQANIEARELSGYLGIRAGQRGGPGRVTARLARLVVPPDSREVEQLLDEAPETIPALDIQIEDFDLRGKKLGSVEVEAVNRNVQGVREWRLTKIAIQNPDARFSAVGNWVPVASMAPSAAARSAPLSASRRTALSYQLDIVDAGRLLARLGLPNTVRGGSGKIEGQLAWIGSPFAFDYPTLSGELALARARGQFLKADPGVARLLGVLSLQSLPRRIALDFRDVFSEGFGFDQVSGNARIERGIVSTNNLRMKGVQANVLMEGSTDLARETQNLYVIIEPDVNLGTASLAYAAINPAIGLTTFFLQWIARKPLGKALAYEYQVSGSWSDMKVEPVKRGTAASQQTGSLAPQRDAAVTAGQPPPLRGTP